MRIERVLFVARGLTVTHRCSVCLRSKCATKKASPVDKIAKSYCAENLEIFGFFGFLMFASEMTNI